MVLASSMSLSRRTDILRCCVPCRARSHPSGREAEAAAEEGTQAGEPLGRRLRKPWRERSSASERQIRRYKRRWLRFTGRTGQGASPLLREALRVA